MREAEALAQIIEALAQEGFVWRRGSNPPTFEGSMAIGERSLRLEIVFSRLDFTMLPRVRLLDRATELPGHRAHVEDDAICYSSPGTLVLDMYEPGRHALTVLRLARRTLGDILSGEAEVDLAIEFPQHWRDANLVHVALPRDAPAGRASVARLERLGAVPALVLARRTGSDDILDLGAFGIFRGAGSAAYLAVTDKALSVRQGEVLPGNLADFLGWAGRVDPALPDSLMHGLFAARGRAMLFVQGPNGCVGAAPCPPETWQQTKRDPDLMARMLRAHPERVPVLRLRGNPADTGHVMARNLVGAPTLARRRVAVVGCGTIGGHLAKFLAQSGAGVGGGRLDLIDSETLLPANLGRHWLPARWVACSKALACAAEIRATFPHSDVAGHPGDVLLDPDVLDGAELVIDATGEQPISAVLNDRMVQRADGAALLLVWLRGMGAAAQALLVPSAGDGRGCYRCLRPDLGSWSAGDVMAPHATMVEAPASCGEAAFLPYGVAAPAVAAGLGARMALEWAGGRVSPSLRTIRLDLAETVPVEDTDLPTDSSCPACSPFRAPCQEKA